MKEEKLGKFDKWEVENALSDLERAERHKRNSALMVEVQKLAKKKVKEISSIAQLKSLAKEKEKED